MCVFPAKF